MISQEASGPRTLNRLGATTPNCDFIQWAKQTIEHLEQKNYDEIDVNQLIDEINLLVERDKKQFQSLLFELLIDLLQWQYQPEKRFKPQADIKKTQTIWANSITYQRDKIHELLEKSPSLRDLIPGAIVRHYPVARALTANEAGIDIVGLSIDCPYTIEQILDEKFWPEGINNLDLSEP